LKKKAVSGIMLTILFIGALTLAFNTQQVEAGGTIYIRADGGIEPSTANITSIDNVTYTFTGNINDEIVVQRDNIIVDGNGHKLEGSGTGRGFWLFYRNNVTIKNTRITGFEGGIYLYDCSHNNLTNNVVSNNYWCQVYLESSENNLLLDNTVSNNSWHGIQLVDSCDNRLTNNTVSNNYGYSGIELYTGSDNNTLSGNTILNNAKGIELHSSDDNRLYGNKVSNSSDVGIYLETDADDNLLCGNTVSNNSHGIQLTFNSGNFFSGNTVSNNSVGIFVWISNMNLVYHNNFFNNTIQVDSYNSINTWDYGYPAAGNYWSDYTGVDSNGDEIGDTPYTIDTNNTDRYPLMYPARARAYILEVGPGKAYLTIQAAVDAASLGDIILVFDGTYNEALYINKTLTLRAASSPVINGSQSVTTNYGARDAVVFVEDSASVVIEGFDIEGNGLGTTNPKSYGVIYENSSGTIKDCIVSPNTVGDLQSTGIACWDNSSLTVDTCRIETFGRIGVFYYSGCSGGVYDSTIIGQVYSGEGDVSYGIEVGAHDFPCNIEIIGNEIYNCSNTFSPEPTLSSAGVAIDGWRAYYDLPPSTVVIKENNIHDNYYGIEVVANSLSYAHYNNIQNNREYGVVSDSDYLGNNATFDARFNYWSHSSGPGPVGPGEGDNVTQYVDFEPWLSCYTPYTTTLLYIDPPTIDKQAIEECSTFEVEVVIANVTDLYGFDLKLTWNDTLLDLAAVEYQTNLDQIWSNWDDAKNETGAGWYRLVAHETKENGFTGDATLINLTFHIKYGPCYIEENYQLGTLIHFALVKLSDPNSTAICTKVQDAKYTVHAVKPKLEIRPGVIAISKFYEAITVQIWLVNASKVYDYAFNITYDTEILHAVNVEWSNFLAGPYYHKSWHINETTGVIEISLAETAQAPPAEGDGLLVNITFRHAVIVWKDCPLWTNLLNCTIEFDWWKLSLRCPELHEIAGNIIDVSNSEYSYTPIQGDVNSDGEVDGFDLRLVSVYYDQSQPEDYDLNCDGIIDIFDLIYIATEIDC